MIQNNVMDRFDEDVTIHHQSVYGFGHWVLSKSALQNGDWELIVNDWYNFHNKSIINYVENKSVVVQAGGWQGLYPFLLSNMFKTVYTFEPNPLNFYCLSQNCQRKNIIKFQAGLSNFNEVKILDESFGSGQHRIQCEKESMWDISISDSYPIYSMTIDSLNLSKCDFIMLDVENYEKYILDGATNTIKNLHPVICVENSFNIKNNEYIYNFLQTFRYNKIDEFNNNIYYK